MGNVVDSRELATRSMVVKGISVRLLLLIAHLDDLSELCGDIGNAFIQADTKEKIYTRCGPEFGNMDGSIALIVRALYGLCTSAERFRTLLVKFYHLLTLFQLVMIEMYGLDCANLMPDMIICVRTSTSLKLSLVLPNIG